jgi:hypothetical protein
MNLAFSNANGSLAELESAIEGRKESFLDVGLAFWKIRQQRLYHQHGYLTFEEYCHDRWNLTGEAVQDLIEVVRVLRLW